VAVALIVAAGRGERLGAGVAKALVPLAGRPLLSWSLDALRGVAAIERIVVALPPRATPPELDTGAGAGAGAPVSWVLGGETRSESVARALAAAGDGDPVLVHDAARPLVTPALAQAVLDALPGAEAAIAAAPVTDTIKRAGADRVVCETLARDELWAVQTPQAFGRAALERALEVAPEVLAAATDDAWLVERAGGRVRIVPAPRENLKVTTALDLRVAELLLAARAAGPA
jgi:2-C-methyl-D-erythritol 4-phosphate cytidylyltransferase